jgi:hypothetical protein
MLARPELIAPIGALAARHHERMDGCGYHRGSSGAQRAFSARLLAAADAYLRQAKVPRGPAAERSSAAPTAMYGSGLSASRQPEKLVARTPLMRCCDCPGVLRGT